MKTETKQAKSELQEAMASGVFVEFRDQDGRGVGQAAFADWRDRPVPVIGDAVSCMVGGSSQPRKLSGTVAQRQFDVDVDEQGEASVWVRLMVEVETPVAQRPSARRSSRRFSHN
ncbi:MAG: hypothetical protein N2C14_16960 [Planctomycetales bacterium]